MKFGLNIHFSIILYKNILDDERIRKNIALQYLKYQMCNIEFFASEDCIFLKFCATEEHEIWPKYSIFYFVLI